MVVRPSKKGRGPVKLFWKSLLSIAIVLALYEGLIEAFHLLNLPSTPAVFGGMCLLLLLAAGGFVVFRNIWRQK